MKGSEVRNGLLEVVCELLEALGDMLEGPGGLLTSVVGGTSELVVHGR